MSGMVLGDVASRHGFTWLLSLPMWGHCGWASLPPAPSYSLQPLDEGTWPLARRCVVPLLQWAVAHFWGM
jgi:hypothetical protein